MRASAICAMLTAAVAAATASAQSITTLFASNGGGLKGGAMYFDIAVGPDPLEIIAFDTNTGQLHPFGWTVYTTPGTSVGKETNPGAWTRVATGTGVGMGINVPSPVALDNTFTLDADTSYGIALVMGPEAGHRYTNGNGANQHYSNADITLDFGGASSVPFTGTIFNPRVWNGTIYYNIVTACYADCDENGALDIDDFLCFQLAFALGDPYADCDENGSLNIDDFICFQLAFALGC